MILKQKINTRVIGVNEKFYYSHYCTDIYKNYLTISGYNDYEQYFKKTNT